MRIEGVNEPQEFIDRIEEVFTILETEDRESELFKQTREWFLDTRNWDRISNVMDVISHGPDKFNEDGSPTEKFRLFERWMEICGVIAGSPYNALFKEGMDAFFDELEEINEIEDEVERKRRMDEFDSRED